MITAADAEGVHLLKTASQGTVVGPYLVVNAVNIVLGHDREKLGSTCRQ